MDDKLKSKILRLLSKAGISPDEAADFLAQDEVNEEAGKSEADTESEKTPKAPAEEAISEVHVKKAEESPAPEKPATPEPPTVEPPTPPVAAGTLPAATVPPETPPTPEPLPAPEAPVPSEKPADDYSQFAQLKGELNELRKAVEGLRASNASLLKNLAEAGSIDLIDDVTRAGIDENRAPARDPSSASQDDVLARLNRGKGY